MIDDVIPGDTTPEAFVEQLRVLARLSNETRATMSSQLSDNLRAILEAGVRQRHPDYDERTVQLATIRCMLGDKLFREVYPDVDVQP